MLLASLTGITGCASRQAAPKPVPLRGAVNLAALVQQHPGWRGVRQYDEALSRLQAAAARVSGPSRTGGSLGSLPPEPGLISGAGLAPSDTRLDQAQSRLEGVERTRLDRLRARRESARRDQLAESQRLWAREARSKFPLPEPDDATVSDPDLDVQLLRVNIQALTRTYDAWSKAKRPAPDLEALKSKIARQQDHLAQLIAARAARQEAVRVERVAARERARLNRAQYVQTQTGEKEAALKADDEQLITRQKALLASQLASLMATGDARRSGAPPVLGSLGAQALPALSAPGAPLSRQSIQSAEANLRAQRARWIAFLYDDARAAAQDAASQQNWQITFAPPRPGERDLTQPLAQTLAATVWRVAATGP